MQRQTYIHTLLAGSYSQTDRQAHPAIQIYALIYTQIHADTGRECIYRQLHAEIDRDRHRQTQAGRDRHRQTKTDRDMQSHTETDIDRQRYTYREREPNIHIHAD